MGALQGLGGGAAAGPDHPLKATQPCPPQGLSAQGETPGRGCCCTGHVRILLGAQECHPRSPFSFHFLCSEKGWRVTSHFPSHLFLCACSSCRTGFRGKLETTASPRPLFTRQIGQQEERRSTSLQARPVPPMSRCRPLTVGRNGEADSNAEVTRGSLI